MVNEGIVFFSGGLGEGLKPVGVVAGAVVNGPALHSFGHLVGHFARERFLIVDGVAESLVGFGRKVFKHLLTVEHVFAVIFLRTFGRNLHRVGLAVEGFVDHLKSE